MLFQVVMKFLSRLVQGDLNFSQKVKGPLQHVIILAKPKAHAHFAALHFRMEISAIYSFL
jgi:hypothetical protein